MNFKKYQHLERYGTTEVEGIEYGRCYIFPKLDGTNASIWAEDGKVMAGSRKRLLSLDSDNAGFYAWVIQQENIISYLKKNPTHRLYGEWLVPHTLKTYNDEAWRNFYVFDVSEDKDIKDIKHDGDDKVNYIKYEDYSQGLDDFNIKYVSPICIIDKPSKSQLYKQLDKNIFLIKDGQGVGEGIVIKNYDFKNKFNRQTWAKIVTSEFKEQHKRVMGVNEIKGVKMIEEGIAKKYVTKALCLKVLAKIENDGGFNQKRIPQLLNTIYYDLVREDCWNFVKDSKNGTIDFKRLQHFTFSRVKELLQDVFK